MRVVLGFGATVAALTTALWAADAAGGGSDCEFIKDSDMRHYCRAVATGHRTWCEWIRQGDLRTRCRWEVDRRNDRRSRGAAP